MGFTDQKSPSQQARPRDPPWLGGGLKKRVFVAAAQGLGEFGWCKVCFRFCLRLPVLSVSVLSPGNNNDDGPNAIDQMTVTAGISAVWQSEPAAALHRTKRLRHGRDGSLKVDGMRATKQARCIVKPKVWAHRERVIRSCRRLGSGRPKRRPSRSGWV